MGIGEQFEFEKTGRIDPEPSKNRIFGNQGLGFSGFTSFGNCPRCAAVLSNPYGCGCGYVNTALTNTSTPGLVSSICQTVGYNTEVKWDVNDCWSQSKLAMVKHYTENILPHIYEEPWPTDEEGSLINNRKFKPSTIGRDDYV